MTRLFHVSVYDGKRNQNYRILEKDADQVCEILKDDSLSVRQVEEAGYTREYKLDCLKGGNHE